MAEDVSADERTATTVPAATSRPRWRRGLRLAARASATGMVAVITALGLLVGLTPAVNDTPRRASAYAAAHGGSQLLSAPPVRLAAAVLAVEDHRFYHHPGIDPLAVARVVIGAVRGRDEGGSTIDVQLAKLLYTDGRANVPAQLEKLALAVKLDHRYSKQALLTMYLNVVYFGHGFSGASAAAAGYFGIRPADLDWPQAALLAGLLRNPDGDDPVEHPQQALARRDYALSRLADMGVLSRDEARRYQATGLELQP